MGLLWLLLVPLPLLVGVYLIWQHSGIRHSQSALASKPQDGGDQSEHSGK